MELILMTLSWTLASFHVFIRMYALTNTLFLKFLNHILLITTYFLGMVCYGMMGLYATNSTVGIAVSTLYLFHH